MRGGQKLTNNLSDAKRQLQELLLFLIDANAFCPVVGYEETNKLWEKKRLKVLISRFDRPAAIRILDIFDLSYSSGVSAFTVLLTDIFVLLQFKFAEG